MSSGPSLLSLFTFCYTIKIIKKKKKVMECKCSINVKSSPGCATDRNIKRYHLRAKWCVCVFKEHFSEQFFLTLHFLFCIKNIK